MAKPKKKMKDMDAKSKAKKVKGGGLRVGGHGAVGKTSHGNVGGGISAGRKGHI